MRLNAVEDPRQIPTLWYYLRISEEAGGCHTPNPKIPGVEVKLVTQLASILLFGGGVLIEAFRLPTG